MQVMTQARGHDSLSQFNKDDLATWHQLLRYNKSKHSDALSRAAV
jgi:hypothetical protein